MLEIQMSSLQGRQAVAGQSFETKRKTKEKKSAWNFMKNCVYTSNVFQVKHGLQNEFSSHKNQEKKKTFEFLQRTKMVQNVEMLKSPVHG